MNHWLIAPILLPLITGALLLVTGHGLQRGLSLCACAALLPLALGLLHATTDGTYHVYSLGDWPAPFGIVLVLDRLSALMLLLTALVALASLAYAVLRASDGAGRYFHPLIQFQLMGLNGAFLTGDLFNLFVFFEILLIASYGLLLHGGGAARSRAGLHYVILNLAGSALFLLGIGVLYGVTGTLNMADLALKIAASPAEDAGLLRAGALLLLVVFGLKAALLPLYFWLPAAYSNTSAAVAALFAIMTKVGVYAIVRVFVLIFGPAAGAAADVAAPWLLPLALATLAAGALGALACRDLSRLLAYFVVVSVGTLLSAVGLFSARALDAALVYLIHSTLVTAGMFILADLIRIQRGNLNMAASAPVMQPLLLGGLFFTGAVALAGLPPLSGFLGKLMILQAAVGTGAVTWVWAIIVVSGLLAIVAFSRMGSSLLWKTGDGPAEHHPITPGIAAPAVVLLACSPLIMVAGAAITEFTAATAAQLTQPAAYINSVLPGGQTGG